MLGWLVGTWEDTEECQWCQPDVASRKNPEVLSHLSRNHWVIYGKTYWKPQKCRHTTGPMVIFFLLIFPSTRKEELGVGGSGANMAALKGEND